MRGFTDTAAEIEAVAEQIERLLVSGLQAGDIAIFARSERVLRERASATLDLCGVAGQELSDDSPIEPARVSIGTMHRAKGLEFKAVIVIGVSSDLLPVPAALHGHQDPADREALLEQERQLLYVACTRAREHLLVTHTGEPSEFLHAFDAAETPAR